MKQEDKKLLFKYLSMALPYGIKGIITFNGDKDIFTIKGVFNILFLSDTECCHIEDFKPYLRSLSSMTDEEMDAYINTGSFLHTNEIPYNLFCTTKGLLFLLNNHFDIFGLIPKGLAIEVTEENNPYNTTEE